MIFFISRGSFKPVRRPRSLLLFLLLWTVAIEAGANDLVDRLNKTWLGPTRGRYYKTSDQYETLVEKLTNHSQYNTTDDFEKSLQLDGDDSSTPATIPQDIIPSPSAAPPTMKKKPTRAPVALPTASPRKPSSTVAMPVQKPSLFATLPVVPPVKFPININCGFTTQDWYDKNTKILWHVDDYFQGNGSLPITEDFCGSKDALYCSYRLGFSIKYKIPVISKQAKYKVTMHFVEKVKSRSNQRPMNITIGDKVVATNFDIFNLIGGKDKRGSITFNSPLVSGILPIEISAVTSKAIVSGIVIERA